MAVNFTKNQDDLTKAWRKVVDTKDSQQWALFGYEGNTNTIKLMSTGSNGLKELVREFNCSLIQYAFIRVLHDDFGLNKLILINWQGDSSPLSRKGLCASHVGDIANYFKGCTQTITIRNDDEATEEYLMEQIIKTSHSRIRSMSRLSTNSSSSTTTNNNLQQQLDNTNYSSQSSKEENVGSTYKKTDISSDITSDRKSFWQRQEEEEKERLLEEKKRAAEKQAQFERERKLREESEAKKLAETIKERDRLIEATRKAERQDSISSGSQPNSIGASNLNNNDDDDRVGRRSELIRLERNQETQSLISKGLIKNKRAIFEQAASNSQQQPPQPQSNLSRRPSGAMITQRMNSLKSFENNNNSTMTTTQQQSFNTITATATSNNSSNNIDKLTNGLAEQVKINAESIIESKGNVIKKEIETFHITNNEIDEAKSSIIPQMANGGVVDHEKSQRIEKQESKILHNNQIVENGVTVNNHNNNNNINKNETADNVNNNNIEQTPNKNSKSIEQDSITGNQKESIVLVNEQNNLTNGNHGIKAKALYDYQAADRTEISFDPDDIIGYIEKVDAGWWHGTVITGTFKGQIGLFPSNYVEEL